MQNPIRIACLCSTYKRPTQLANVIACFESQDYKDRELIVLDDAGQYDTQSGDRWKIVSSPVRFRTLGEKRNATAALVSPDVDAYAVWDDDDAYLPWHLSAAVAALKEGADYTIPTKVLIEKRGSRLQAKSNTYLYHGAWTFTRELFDRVHGYPFMQSGQDQGLLQRFKKIKAKRADPLKYDSRPSYIYRWCTIRGNQHLSAMGRGGYEKLADRRGYFVGKVVPKLERDWEAMAT